MKNIKFRYLTHATHCLLLATIIVSISVPASDCYALPIGFGVNQGPHEYQEIKSDNFYIYFDKRTPEEAYIMLNSLEAARPTFDRWLGYKRERQIPVITSAISANASFANVITDAIELQTRGQGTRDLAWHEYAHTRMYGKLRNFFGPAGTLMPLFFMPAWFLEGFAETMSVSVDSDVQMGIEKYHALTGSWPSYESLHSLYNTEFSLRGYATAGSFTAWVIRQGNPDKIPELLEDFYDYTLPHWWPWAVIPFNDFLPMDAALQNYSGKTGEELWTEYKAQATAYWTKNASGPLYATEKSTKSTFSSNWGLNVIGEDFTQIVKIKKDHWRVRLQVDKNTSWVTGYKRLQKIAPLTGETKTGLNGDQISYIVSEFDKPSKKKPISRAGQIGKVYNSKAGRLWVERNLSATRLCLQSSKNPKKVVCHLKRTLPKTLTVIGEKKESKDPKVTEKLWLRETEQTLKGDLHNLIQYDVKTGISKTIRTRESGKPIAADAMGEQLFVLFGERNDRTMRSFLNNQGCQRTYHFKDHIETFKINSKNEVLLAIYGGNQKIYKVVDLQKSISTDCIPSTSHSSPLLEDHLSNTPLRFSEAMKRSNLWQNPSFEETADQLVAAQGAKPLNQDFTDESITKEPVKAKWRGRPVFAFPWIGGNDAYGTQVGVISVPLMDHMQNESIRLSLLLGLESRYPDQELAFVSTRFTPDLNLTLFRHQTYNGRFVRRVTRQFVNAYYDEKGAKFSLSHNFKFLNQIFYSSWGLKYSYMSPYIGPRSPVVGKGFKGETFASLGTSYRLGSFSFSNSINAKVIPKVWNKDFDYDQLGASFSITRRLPLNSKITAGIEGSRTRGEKPLALKEIYTPLKTFIPGSGGGINQTSYALTADQGLFSSRFGDTQGRFKTNITTPLIENVDSLWYVIYVERLDISAFYNYGDAWTGDSPSKGWDSLLSSHGLNLDLQFDNKGVRFNSGAGIGKVAGNNYQAYLKFGFDALF